MKLFLTGLAAAAMLTAPALAAPCRDASGKFVTCPKKTTTKVIQKSSTTTTTTGGKCRDAKGHFAKCGTPGAKPV